MTQCKTNSVAFAAMFHTGCTVVSVCTVLFPCLLIFTQGSFADLFTFCFWQFESSCCFRLFTMPFSISSGHSVCCLCFYETFSFNQILPQCVEPSAPCRTLTVHALQLRDDRALHYLERIFHLDGQLVYKVFSDFI